MRDPGTFVQIKLRLRQAEHQQLEAAAREHGATMSGEAAARIAQTFRNQGIYEAAQMVVDIRHSLAPLLESAHALAMSAEAARAADRMAALAIASPVGTELRAAAEGYLASVRAAEIEARLRYVRAGAPQS